MSKDTLLEKKPSSDSKTAKFVTVRLDKQIFGLSAMDVDDVLLPHPITPVPLAPKEIMGLLNLRGRIVTAIDLRVKMGMEPLADRLNRKNIVIEYNDNLYSFIVDEVTGVCDIPLSEVEKTPENLSEEWKKYCTGIYKLEKELMVLLNINGLLHQQKNSE